jgi:outer membrane protein assembly factor BamB
METPATIDLGLADPLRPAGDADLIVRPVRRRRPRWTAAAVVAIALALTINGPPSSPPHLLNRVGVLRLPAGGDFRLFPDGVYTFVATEAGGSQLVAYSLEGVAAWRLEMPRTADSVVVTESGGTTFVQFGLAATADTGFVWALDRLTGRREWQVSSAQVLYTRGDRVLMTRRSGAGVELTWHDGRTGKAIWQRTVDVAWNLSSVAPDGSDLYALAPTGELRAFALNDRGTERDAQLTAPTGFEELAQHTFMSVGDVLVVMGPSVGAAAVRGYRLMAVDGAPGAARPVVAPSWAAQFAGAGTRGRSALSIARCGVVICAYTDGDVRAVDPESGQIRWIALSSLVTPVGAWLMTVPISPIGGYDSTVIDPHDGQPLLPLGQWSLVSANEGDSTVFLASSSVAIEDGLVTDGDAAPASARDGNMTAYLAVLTAGNPQAPPRLRTLGRIEVPGLECQVDGGLIGCLGSTVGAPPNSGGLVEIWSFHRP